MQVKDVNGMMKRIFFQFLHGSVYIREGNTLRPARVEYPPGQNPFRKTRVARRRKRKRREEQTEGQASNDLPEVVSGSPEKREG